MLNTELVDRNEALIDKETWWWNDVNNCVKESES